METVQHLSSLSFCLLVSEHKTINKPEAVAKNKAIQGAQLAGGACVVEDTSLEFSALGGMPGKIDGVFTHLFICLEL